MHNKLYFISKNVGCTAFRNDVYTDVFTSARTMDTLMTKLILLFNVLVDSNGCKLGYCLAQSAAQGEKLISLPYKCLACIF